MNPWEELDKLLEASKAQGVDVRVELTVMTDCYWGCELSFTAEPNSSGCDRSLVLYAVGGEEPEEVLSRCLYELAACALEALPTFRWDGPS